MLTGSHASRAKSEPISLAALGGARGAYLTSRSHPGNGFGDADLWILPKGRSSSRPIATFLGAGTDLARVGGHNDYALVGSSADGSTWLVRVFHWPGLAAFADCDELFAIRTDGSPAVSLGQAARTSPFVGGIPVGFLSPDGRRRAYSWILASSRIGDTGQRDQHPTGSAKCESSYVAEWAPNGRSVAVGCDGAVAIVDDPSGRSRLVALPDGMMPYAIRWTDDGQRLLIGSVDGGHPRFDLQILSIAISSDEISVVDRVDPTSFELTDTLAFRPTFSPDGHSLMVVGSRAEADYDHAVIYVVRTRGGLPREVLDGYQVSGSREDSGGRATARRWRTCAAAGRRRASDYRRSWSVRTSGHGGSRLSPCCPIHT